MYPISPGTLRHSEKEGLLTPEYHGQIETLPTSLYAMIQASGPLQK